MDQFIEVQRVRICFSEMFARNGKTIPVHVSPVKPSLQMQVNEPSLFIHSELLGQINGMSMHSSISSANNCFHELNLLSNFASNECRNLLPFMGTVLTSITNDE